MPANVIEIEHLSKRYLLGEDTAGRAGLGEAMLARLTPRRAQACRNREEIWSLRDIDLVIQEGEALGVVGRNGAGKSTLLKILSRITEPTAGVCRTVAGSAPSSRSAPASIPSSPVGRTSISAARSTA